MKYLFNVIIIVLLSITISNADTFTLEKYNIPNSEKSTTIEKSKQTQLYIKQKYGSEAEDIKIETYKDNSNFSFSSIYKGVLNTGILLAKIIF